MKNCEREKHPRKLMFLKNSSDPYVSIYCIYYIQENQLNFKRQPYSLFQHKTICIFHFPTNIHIFQWLVFQDRQNTSFTLIFIVNLLFWCVSFIIIDCICIWLFMAVKYRHYFVIYWRICWSTMKIDFENVWMMEM